MNEALGGERGAVGEGGELPVLEKEISRRRALKVLGVLPVATALGAQQPVQKPLTPAVTSQVPTKPGAQPHSPPVPSFFNAHEMRTVRMLADYVIPRDARSGSATDAKVPEYMDYLLGEKDASETTRTEMRGGLAWLDAESGRRFGKRFIEATDPQRRQLLDDIAYPEKAPAGMSQGVAFFNRFRDMTASGFYSSAIGWHDVQYIGNVFNPGYDGCPPAALEKLGVSYDVMNTRVAPQEK
ncbi:MAG TPA: gluconate 2-dehydrogenase subunit 3 family protein [Gemmatimonadaceae bacterium]|nr:gluconate 2-dehydrogenase subunit 3 family protein [Gemmatimonadaceae bacterium]